VTQLKKTINLHRLTTQYRLDNALVSAKCLETIVQNNIYIKNSDLILSTQEFKSHHL